MNIYSEIKECRVCKSEKLKDVFRIDDQYLSPTFVKENQSDLSKIKIPHTLILCENCNLLQLRETVNPDILYKKYFYRSSVSDTMRSDLKDVVDDIQGHVNLSHGDCIVDIGANDCTMISYFSENLSRYAIEPAENINWDNVDPSIKIVNDYFTENSLLKCNLANKVKVFSSCAMFYDLEEPNSFVEIIKKYLHEEGVFCIQLSYLPSMIKNINFYDICNEHLEYYSLHTLNNLMSNNGLEIYHAEENDVNGGSIRVMISHKEANKRKSKIYMDLVNKEKLMQLDKIETYKNFHQKIISMKEKVLMAIHNEMKEGLVIGLGASTKGNMLMQTFGLTKKEIPYISERNPDKVGLRTLGTDIELIAESAARKMSPKMMLVFPWYFKKEIIDRESDYIKSGGKLLIPMPYPHIISFKGEEIL
tara:strand:- start:104 stop:1360 length:1257 start_codon:yes stop_codon:yes gene_type:complete